MRRGEFLADLIKGQADAEATTRLADKVAALTGIDQAVSRRLAGRFEVGEFRREFDRRNGRVTGRYDASVSGFDPYPDSSYAHFGDPSGDSLMRAADQRRGRPHHAQAQLAARRLVPVAQRQREPVVGFRPRAGRVGFAAAPDSRARSETEAAGRRTGCSISPRPISPRKSLLDQLPAFAGPDRVKLVVYPGGHMFYSRDGARQAFRVGSPGADEVNSGQRKTGAAFNCAGYSSSLRGAIATKQSILACVRARIASRRSQ